MNSSTQNEKPLSILICDDEKIVLDEVTSQLKKLNPEPFIDTAESLNEIGISKINSHQHSVSTKPVVIKDWSNDDTEPGDDNDYSLGFDRIVSEDDASIGSR